jgi:CTP:molybdopterin cytidylyltransferase MocA
VSVAGFVLAAGAGRRAGGPKALRRGADGRSWLQRSIDVLHEGGCRPLAVVLGAAAEEGRAALAPEPPTVTLVNERWEEGMGSSLRLALDWCASLPAEVEAALVMLVDTPGVTPAVVRELCRHAQGPQSLARASYGAEAEPGHPVLLGRAHWGAIRAQCAGERGAADYLAARDVQLVDCRALGSGFDQDAPEPRLESPGA